ncbi:MAG: spore coat protein [Bacillota bacterium]
MRLDDKDILADCLKDAKFFSESYHVATLESTNDQIRNTFLRMMNDEMATAKMIFDAMHQRGWYQVDMARATAPGAQAQYANPAGGIRPDYPGMQTQGFHPRPETSFQRPEGDPTNRW